MAERLEHVKRIFAIEQLSDIQLDTINKLLKGKDVLLSIRTGGGKSLCYQAYPILRDRDDCQVLIVSPLLSIMKEQVQYLRSLGLSADYIHADCDADAIRDGKTTYVYTSPEAILSDMKWRTMLTESNSFRLFVVDEAHMVINWGEGTGKEDPFREWYGRLGEIRSLIQCEALVITATASKTTRRKLKSKLALCNCHDIVESPDRENIKLFVTKIKANQSLSITFSFLINMLKSDAPTCSNIPRHIVFCPSIKLCAEVYSTFRIHVPERMEYVQMFHSCTTDAVKDALREDMEKENGKIRILIATSPVGMGVNYKGLNNILHYGPPKDLDAFIQQLGRAGRDGTQSYQMLIYNGRHLRKLEEDMMKYVQNNEICRRRQLLGAYDSIPCEGIVNHLCCDICSKNCQCDDVNCESFKCTYLANVNESTSESSDIDLDVLSDSDDITE